MDEPFAALDAQTREVMQIDLLKIRDQTQKTVLFITHSIDEAVFLADRVAVMTARPGGVIKTIIDIPIPRKSRLSNDVRITREFIETRHKLWELLKEEVVKAQKYSKSSIEDCTPADSRSIKKAPVLSIPLDTRSE